jgi:hypothetical protein
MFCVLLMNLLKLGFNHIIIVDGIYLTISKLERFAVLLSFAGLELSVRH